MEVKGSDQNFVDQIEFVSIKRHQDAFTFLFLEMIDER